MHHAGIANRDESPKLESKPHPPRPSGISSKNPMRSGSSRRFDVFDVSASSDKRSGDRDPFVPVTAPQSNHSHRDDASLPPLSSFAPAVAKPDRGRTLAARAVAGARLVEAPVALEVTQALANHLTPP